MRVVVIIVLNALSVFSVCAQNGYTIRVEVRDSNGPVAGAVVTLTLQGETQPKYEKVSDAAGIVAFHASPGRYVIRAVKRIGERSFASPEMRVEANLGDPVSLDLLIEELPRIQESVLISADLPQAIDEVSKTVNVIGGQEMRERADFTLVESLRSIPGFRVQQLGGFGRTASIKTRGLRNQDTAILLDGVRLRDAAAITGDASPFLSDVTLTSVSRVEVLRGSGSSLYGTNAIGGTVNFITPLPRPGPHGQVSYAAGGLGLHRFRGNFSDGTSSGKFGFNLAVARTAYTEGIDGNDNAHNTNVQGRILFQPASATSISGRFFISDAFVRLNSNPDTLGILPPSNSTVIDAEAGVNFAFDADDPDNTQRSKFYNGQIVVNHAVNADVALNAFYSGLKTSRRNENGPLGVPFQSASTSFFDGLIQTANATVDWQTGKINTLKFGYEFEDERFGNDGLTPDGSGNFFTRAGQSSHTVFAQNLVGLYDGRLQLAGGVRAQFFDLRSPRFSLENAPYSNLTLSNPPAAYTFDGAASYFFRSTGTKIRVHIGNGYRVPSLFERFGTFFSSFGKAQFVALGDPRLGPERSIAFDGGIEQRLFGDKANLSAVYFYTRLTDTIGFGNDVPDIGETQRPFGGYLNTKGGLARGAEFSGRFKPAATTDVFASYTFTNSDQREPQVAGSGVISTLGLPEHQFTMVAAQRFGRFWVSFDLLASSSYLAPIFSGSTFSTYIYRFEGNRRGDLTSGYTFKLKDDKFDLRLFGTLENLFDNEYFENGFRTAGSTRRVGISFGF
jgi:iron complex outermembrane receptor protein